MSHEARLIELFDRLADDGTAEQSELLLGDVVRQAFDVMEVRPGHQILDLGCGIGWTTRLLGKAAPGAQAVGIDVSPAMIAKADGLSDWTSRARFERMAIEALDFADGRFDHVVAFDVLEYVEDPERALESAARVTKAGGKIELLFHAHAASPSTESWSEQLGLPLHRLDESAWSTAVESAGFTVDSADFLRDARETAPFEATLVVPDEVARDALHSAGILRLRATR
jgi:SAM-dependent methyltransferase